jgi:hypothetical protein
MEEVRIDVRIPEQANPEEGRRCMDLCFRINHTHPLSEEFSKLVSELFCGNIGEGSRVLSPMTVVRGHRVKIGEVSNAHSKLNESQIAPFAEYERETPIGQVNVGARYEDVDFAYECL